jgi:hypothetical protein
VANDTNVSAPGKHAQYADTDEEYSESRGSDNRRGLEQADGGQHDQNRRPMDRKRRAPDECPRQRPPENLVVDLLASDTATAIDIFVESDHRHLSTISVNPFGRLKRTPLVFVLQTLD